MSIRIFLFTFLLFPFTSSVFGQQSKTFMNKYVKYNSDKTLRLEYIDCASGYTAIHITYTGTSNIGKFTSLYLNNFRLADRETGAEYKPTSTGPIPTSLGNKFLLYNSGEAMSFTIYFNKLPSYVKHIDLIEGDGGSSTTYNFTFRDLVLDPAKDATEDIEWDWSSDVSFPRYAIFYTYEDLQINIWIDGTFVDKLDRKFNNRDYQPSVGEYGAVTVGFASGTSRHVTASGSISNIDYKWDFDIDPLSSGAKQSLVIKK